MVIPAYKAEFFGVALDSLANQTDQQFRVYVCDDAGSPALQTIAAAYESHLDMVYHRFEQNLGGVSLVKHWRRSIELSSEPWVWLFSDDDIADKNCVSKFYETLTETGERYAVYRFNTLRIDSQGKVIRINPPHPHTEASPDYIYHILTNQRSSYVPEHIFKRAIYDQNHGFVEFPLAWCSDHATWATFGRDTGIRTIQGSHVRWRQSDNNITSLVDAGIARQKLEAVIQFCCWLRKSVESLFTVSQGSIVSIDCLRETMAKWALGQWKLYAPACERGVLERICHGFVEEAGSANAVLWSILNDHAYAEQIMRYPYVATLPRVITAGYPGVSVLLEKFLCLAAVISGKFRAPKR